tara:strand:+ start:368 stop:487 length:120 start_codon:yes stop_codon:yes gene_type:complete
MNNTIIFLNNFKNFIEYEESLERDLNPRPTDYESGALPG